MLKKLQLKSGVNRENTRYTTEGGWYESDKIRFRQGSPEAVGGWERISDQTYIGVCRSLNAWATLSQLILVGTGTNRKFYIENEGFYNDITPLRAVRTLTNPFTTDGTTTVVVTDGTGDFAEGGFVYFSGATAVGGVFIYGEYEILSKLTATTYTIQIASPAAAGSGGGSVNAEYQINPGAEIVYPITGWGAGYWSQGVWGDNRPYYQPLAIWSQTNYGEDLIFGRREEGLYYWDATIGIQNHACLLSGGTPLQIDTDISLADGSAVAFATDGTLPTGISAGTIYYVVNAIGATFNIAATPGGAAINTTGAPSTTVYLSPRGVPLTALAGASDVPTIQTGVLVADGARIVLCFGANGLGQMVLDPMLIRWSDQEDPTNWTPAVTNQAGDIRLSVGSKIVSYLQTRQEILVWTDTALYSLQYVGPPVVWTSQILANDISVAGPKVTATASNVVYWMGADKFYMYDGNVRTLNCDLRSYVFNDINYTQAYQFFAGVNESFNEVWWFYCSAGSNTIDRYVVYNYLEQIWYYGTMARTAWMDSGILHNPIAAAYSQRLIKHEFGLNDNETGTPVPIHSYILSSEFDLEDGHKFTFIQRVLPDATFKNSTAASPSLTLSLYPLDNSGSGYVNAEGSGYSVGGYSYAGITRTATVPIEQFTGQVFTRVRGRQLAFKVECNALDTTWQWGAPRLDIRPDGRR